MSKRIVKYNPAFLSNEELVRSFVVRHAELELIEQVLRENVTKSNQHVLVIGPRGIGKTMLVLRVVEEARTEKDLSKRWYPLVFSEESYQVTTPGEFWLEALFHLGQKTGEACWKQTYRELSNEQDENRLRERALGQLMDFADTKGKRILLVVENFNMLLGEQIGDSDGWALRHTLLNEPRIMLLATATSRFEEIDNCGKPMFEQFRTLELRPLDRKDCRVLWTSVTGKKPSDKRVRPLQILTGGNPRLLAIVSTFAVIMSLKELMSDLMQLVDEHTEYFKSHLDRLPAVERKTYLALAELWDPATAREVADVARLNVNKTSSLLRRLMERGAVVLADGRKRTKLYQVAERMYNIYYLMRRRGAPSRRVKALVQFMANFYEEEQLVSLAGRIAEEACGLEPGLRKEHFWAYECILESVPEQSLRDKLIEITPCDFFKMQDIPTSLKGIANKRLVTLLKKADALSKEADKLSEVERLYEEAIEMAPESGITWTSFGNFLQGRRRRYTEAEKAYRKAIELKPDYAWGWANFGSLLHRHLRRYEEAENAYRKAIDLRPELHWAWEQLGDLLRHLKRAKESEKALRRAIELGPDCFLVWTYFGQLLQEQLGRYEEAEEAYRKAIELKPDFATVWVQLGWLLHKHLGRYREAEKAYRKAIELRNDYALAWEYFGILLHIHLERYEEAEAAYRQAVELNPQKPCPWVYLGILLQENLKRYEEAEAAYRKAIEKEPQCSWAWSHLGYFFYEVERHEEAEKAFQKALETYEEDACAWSGLLLLLQEKMGRSKEALELLRSYLEKTTMVEKSIDELTELLVGLAASGHETDALEVLRVSPSAKILEPLVVGLQLFVGEDVKAAAEIKEVARDVVKRIEERQDKMQSKPRMKRRTKHKRKPTE